MDKIRIPKVDNVSLWRQGIRINGTLHLTNHHIIFTYQQPPPTDQAPDPKAKLRELWVTYPMIAHCTYRPAPPASHQPSSIRLRCRDFIYVAFHFPSDSQARDVYDTIRSLTCKVGRIEKLYAFSYQPQGPEKDVNGWKHYDAKKEFARLGVSEDGSKGWRLSSINSNYDYSPTYPALIGVPTSISDNVLKYAGSYRSKVRIPALTYLHPTNNCSITRSSQPLVGVRNNRSAQDEKLVAAIFSSSRPPDAPACLSFLSTPTLEAANSEESSTDLSITASESFDGTHALEHEAIAQIEEDDQSVRRIYGYGTQQNNLIVDARPAVNAYANMAAGAGSENMDYYKFATRSFLGVDNIHVMRDSLNKVIDALKDGDVTPMSPNREQLVKSGWLKHIQTLLEGSSSIARAVSIKHSHVLIHCSDGWDRTSQLSAISQLCLDPYYRTLDGFITLVEKDWLSFGHMFRHRTGFLSSDKWFEIENERVSSKRIVSNGSEASPQAGENAYQNPLIKAAKGLFNKENDSRESPSDSDGETPAFDSPPGSAWLSRAKGSKNDHAETKVKETSPVFHQFLDCTYQLMYQHPTRFEFNERFLRRLLYQVYSCQYGTFLYDSEKQRLDAKVSEKTRSVWDFFLSRRHMWMNEQYEPEIDDNVKGKERLIFPRVSDVRWWEELFGHRDMNAPPPPPATAPASSANREWISSRGHSRAPSEVTTPEVGKPDSHPEQEEESREATNTHSFEANGKAADNEIEPSAVTWPSARVSEDDEASWADPLGATRKPVLTGLETSEKVVEIETVPSHVEQMERDLSPIRGLFNKSTSGEDISRGASSLSAGLASLGIGSEGRGSSNPGGKRSPRRLEEDLEVEKR